MGQTLTNGIYLPDEGEVRCYAGLASNWTTLDAVVGGYNAHVANENIHITSAERNKWDNGVSQAYVLRYASVSLTALGTVAFSALDNTDNIKIGDKVLDSEGKLFALTAVDTANSTATLSALLIDLSKDSDLSNYYTKPETDTLLNDKANDTDVLHKTGDETSTGIKNFVDNIVAKKIVSNVSQLQINAKTNADSVAIIAGSLATDGGGVWVYGKNSSNQSHVAMQVYDTNASTFHAARLNMDGSLTPTVANNGLGSSSFKWRGFNSINPGALSLPDLTAGVDISAYITDITGASNINKFTPTADGWISIGLSNADFIEIYIPSSLIGGSFTKSTVNNYGQAFMPVIANKEVRFALKGSSIGWAKLYPCQGNI